MIDWEETLTEKQFDKFMDGLNHIVFFSYILNMHNIEPVRTMYRILNIFVKETPKDFFDKYVRNGSIIDAERYKKLFNLTEVQTRTLIHVIEGIYQTGLFYKSKGIDPREAFTCMIKEYQSIHKNKIEREIKNWTAEE